MCLWAYLLEVEKVSLFLDATQRFQQAQKDNRLNRYRDQPANKGTETQTSL